MARRFELLHSLRDVTRNTKQMDSAISDVDVKKEMFAIGTPVAILDNEYKQIPYDGYGLVYWTISDIGRDMQVYGSGITNDVIASNGLTAFFGKTRLITDNFEDAATSGKAYEAGQELFAKKDGNKTVLTNATITPGAGETVKSVAVVEETITESSNVVALKIRTY
jgi:hypothetical protein